MVNTVIMNSALTKPQSLQELYKTYFSFANKFQFTSLLKNYIQNEEWRDKSQQPVWELLSRISDDIGAVLTDDIVNYTRNVVDVNTCKVPQLIEHAQMLSYRLDHLKNSYAFFPKRIQCLVDLFSVNQEYLIGNHKNHILSDEVIKEILLYIRDNVQSGVSFVWEDYMDKLLTDPHSLVDERTYRDFITKLFYTSIVEALSSRYTDDATAKDQIPIAFNILWKERKDQQNILSRINEYRSWVDKYIWNEIEYPLNDSGLANTIYDNVQQIKAQKQISSKFNPFNVADHIYFNGLNPNNSLSEDEVSLVETVINYHSKTRYDYETQMFVDDMATQYAYYKELEWCEYVKLVMFIVNNIKSFDMTGLTYDISSNKFIQTANNSTDCLRVVKIFNNGGSIVQDSENRVAINHEIIQMVSKFLCDYVFHIQSIRENMKTIAHKHAMRGSGALLAHIVNDYLIKELPVVKEMIQQQDGRFDDFKFLWETNPEFNNYGNVKILEYEDDNEYFNIDPENDVRFTGRTNARYWEQLANMADDETLGVLTKEQIKNFYRNVLGMGRLQTDKPRNYDDICDFLVDLFKVGSNPIKWKSDEDEFYNPIDDIIYDSEEKYGYSKEERLDVQKNTELRKNQERQFLEYSGNEDIVGNSLYDYVNSKMLYWKNTDYSSHALHPFMYNLKLWNKLNNIIINGYKDYVNTDLISYLSSKTKFDEIYGKYGESRNFWKYNIMDLSGYTTRYEAAIKDEHIDDFNNTTSRLTGYDGLFYPDAAQEFLDLINEDDADFTIPREFFTNKLTQDWLSAKGHGFVSAIYSIYWQTHDSFYIKWYSHLNYTRSEYQKIAMQLWYWRDRIEELITTEYPISKYCLDVQGNSLILVQTFFKDDEEKNPYLVDLVVAQNDIQQNRCGNQNTHVSFCEDKLRRPSEMWIRWKSNPIALPAFDLYYDRKTGDKWFDFYYRKKTNIELGQLTHTNSDCNEWFKIVLAKWRGRYENTVHWNKQLDDGTTVELGNNRLPVFFDMEQSASVLALASWYQTDDINEDGIENRDGYGRTMQAICSGKNPMHILSIERTSTVQSEYTLSEYTQDASIVNPRNMLDWQFDSYKYCQANGSILIPLYRFNCVDEQDFVQKMSVRMFMVPAQSLKMDNFATNDRLTLQDMVDIDLNSLDGFGDGYARYRFDHPIKVCRNTNVAFTTYDLNGMNRVKFAFLGTYAMEHDEIAKQEEGKNPDYMGFKVNSCDAQTRYEYDSQSIVDLALTRDRYFEEADRDWKKDTDDNYSDRRYIDSRIYKGDSSQENAFNSYDSNDKYVFVLDFEPSIDDISTFNMSWRNGNSSYAYNIIGDAGYIPHFAYQSLIRYGEPQNGRDGGISFTWRNAYLDSKEHMQFELLGLDDKDIPEEYENMSRLVVDDMTDDCKTLICPAKLADDIYRIWCHHRGVRRNLLPGEEDKYGYKSKYDSYFPNEYKDYANPRLDFNGGDTVEWNISETCGLRDETGNLVHKHDSKGRLMLFGPNGDILYKVGANEYVDADGNEVEDITGCNPRVVDDGLFELDLPMDSASQLTDQTREIEEFKKLLDEYYVYVLRTENGQILNEKRYLLPPTKLSQFFFCAGSQDGFIKCNLSPYQTSLIQDDHFVPTQAVFVGTTNPFRYDENGERIYAKPEELQYGNGIKGVDSLELKVSIITETDTRVLKYDESGNIVAEESNSDGSSQDGGRVVVAPEYRTAIRKKLVPILRFKKSSETVDGLLSRVQHEHGIIEPGQVTVVFSHKNIENIAKYHILNKYSNLYFNGSLPKESQNSNKFKYSDFKYESSVHLRHDATNNRWESVEVGSNGQPILTFNDGDVHGQMQDGRQYPPYYITGDNGVDPLWFLEQVEMFPQSDHAIAKDDVGHHGNSVPGVDGCKPSDDCHASFQENGVTYQVPKEGDFVYAHKVRLLPTKYIDYLYVDRGALSFKISEESESFADAWKIIPPFHIDEVLKNKMNDLNDAQLLKEYSTFIHQSEKPQRVKDCSNFNPLVTNAILNYGLEQKEMHPNENVKVICAEDGRVIELDNHTNFTRLNLQLEDGEIDDCLKIYTNYVRKDDGFGDYHYDLYFNIQNLFHSPFEYISSVTNQPNVLILPDSYLYLPGDKYKRVGGDHNEIDSELVDKLQQGGELALYGQVKTYSNNRLSDVRTIKLFAYQIYNISDDKPKFLIRKTYDVTKADLQNDIKNNIDIHFSDVMWTVDEEQFVFLDENGEYKMDDQFKVLNRDVIVVQPVDIRYNWNKDDDYRVKQISFDIMNDVIDFANTPELCEYWMQARTLRNGDGRLDRSENLVEKGYPYYDHWSDRYMKLEVNPDTGIPRLTLTYDDLDGFNFETIYLKWRLPAGCCIMDTIDRLGGYVFSSTAQNMVAVCNNSRITPTFNVRTGYVTARVHKPGDLYLGQEHSTKMRKSGYVLTGLLDAINSALKLGKENPTLMDFSVSENEIKAESGLKMDL